MPNETTNPNNPEWTGREPLADVKAQATPKKTKANPEADKLLAELAKERALHEQTKTALAVRSADLILMHEEKSKRDQQEHTAAAALRGMQQVLHRWTSDWPDDRQSCHIRDGACLTFAHLKAVRDAGK